MFLGDYSADASSVARGSSNKCAWGKARLAALSSQMNREPEPKIIRRTFANRITAAGGVSNPRVEAAFAVVAREDNLGPEPWQIVRWGGGYRTTPDSDPVYLHRRT